jgi:Glyoxalase-like domain
MTPSDIATEPVTPTASRLSAPSPTTCESTRLAAPDATHVLAHMALELDHIVCMVDDLDQPSRVLERDGWVLDAGTVHVGQGTRNRRLACPEHHLELLCVTDEREARSSTLRLDRRARWSSNGTSPFGVGFRGVLAKTECDDFWLYEENGARIWIHRDNERAPERPLVFVLEASREATERRRPRSGPPALLAHRHGRTLAEVRLNGPAPAAAALQRATDHPEHRPAEPRAGRRNRTTVAADHADPHDPRQLWRRWSSWSLLSHRLSPR